MNLTSLITGDPYVTRAREVCARNPCTMLPNLYTCNPVTPFINYSSFHKQSSIREGICYRSKDTSRNTRNKRFLDGKDSPAAPNRCTSPLTRAVYWAKRFRRILQKRSHPHARGILVRRSK